MQRTSIALLFAAAAALAGCASSVSLAPSAPLSGCEVDKVPAGAVFGTREAMQIATWPAAVPRTGTACQRIWHGNTARPDTMQVLATYHYEGGRVQRLVGTMPGGGGDYDCRYRGGELDRMQSRNPAACPAASEIEAGRR